MKFLDKITQTIKKFDLINEGDKILVAVSGGSDSVALLYALYKLKSTFRISLHVAHLDHSFRGVESEEDALFVEKFAKNLGIPSTIKKVDVPSIIKREKGSAEHTARIVRYRFLRKLAEQIKADKIATGHNANDQAETLLLWLVRGAGLDGLSAIPPKNEKFIRPLIETRKNQIKKFLSDNALKFRQDSSNLEINYTRNFLRHKIFPLLENEINPTVIDNFCKTAEIAAQINDYLDETIKELEINIIKKYGKTKISLDLTSLFDYHIALQNRLLRYAIKMLKGDLKDITYNHLKALHQLIKKRQSGSQLALPDGITAYIEYNELFIIKGKLKSGINFTETEIALFGVTKIPKPKLNIIAEILDIDKCKINYKKTYRKQAFFDADSVYPPLEIRNRKNGDVFMPFGMNRHKKLQDFFVDEKVPLTQRDNIPIIADKKGIIWVVGYRTSERTKITDETKNVIHLRIEDGD